MISRKVTPVFKKNDTLFTQVKVKIKTGSPVEIRVKIIDKASDIYVTI